MREPGVNHDGDRLVDVTADAPPAADRFGKRLGGPALGDAVDRAVHELEQLAGVGGQEPPELASVFGARHARARRPARHRRCERGCQRSVLGLWVGVGEPRRCAHEGSEAPPVVAEADAEERAPHRRAVSRREHAAARGRDAKPQFHDGAEGREPDPGRQEREPDAKLARQAPRERIDLARRGDQGLGHHARVLGVVGHHAPPEEEARAGDLGEQAALPALREALAGEPHAVADGGAEQATEDGVAARERRHPVQWGPPPQRPVILKPEFLSL